MNPIMMGRKFLHQKIEQLYQIQFTALLRQKSLSALDFGRVIRQELKKQFKSTPNYWLHSLANIIYSSHRFAENHAEISCFLRFLRAYKSAEFLFYLFVRQQFINSSHISFINHLKSPKDFKKVVISKPKAVEILRHAFSESQSGLREALGRFHAKFKSRADVPYYDFLVFSLDVDVDHANLGLLDKIRDFYNKRPALASPRAKTYLEEDSHGEVDPQNFLSLQTEPVREDATIRTQEKRVEGTNDRYSRTEQPEELPTLVQKLYPSQSDRHHPRRSEFPNVQMRQMFGKNLKEKEMMLTETIKALLREEISKMLANFIDTFNVERKDTGMISKSLFDLILSKCKTILTMIFFQNRKRFFKLIHKNPSKEKELVRVWEELAGMYEYFKKNEVNSPPVLRQFVKRCLMFPTLEEELLFLLQYMFKVQLTQGARFGGRRGQPEGVLVPADQLHEVAE